MTASIEGRDDRERAPHLPEGPGDIPSDTFAARLVLSRHHAGRLSIAEAAERCGLYAGTWHHWENGKTPRNQIDVARAVADGLDMNFNWLLLGGPLLPARGRPVKRTGGATWRSHHLPVRPATPRTDRRPPTSPLAGSPNRADRRPRLIDNSRPVAV